MTPSEFYAKYLEAETKIKAANHGNFDAKQIVLDLGEKHGLTDERAKALFREGMAETARTL